MITDVRTLRRRFWREHPHASRKLIDYGGERIHCTDTRVAFCDFLDRLRRDGEISERLASTATLGGGS